MQNRVTIIIPNYNGLKFMEPCFAALDRQTMKDFDILVVDNGSSDGSVEWLKEHRIPSIFLPENTGFTGAVNVGIKAAATEYVILLNNDTEAQPGYVKALVEVMERSPNIFSASSRIIQLHNKKLMDDAGDMYSLLGWAYQRGVGQPVKGYKKARRIFAACAAAAIYRRAVFDEIGYFDETHFAYLEDIDVGYRARIFGYDNVYCPEAEIYHVGSGTSGSKYNSFKVRLAARNNVYLNYKNMPFLQLLINLPFILAGVAVKYVFFKKIGFGRDYAEAFFEGIRTAGKSRKVKFQPKHLKNYLLIELELFVGTFIYIWEFLKRQLKKITAI